MKYFLLFFSFFLINSAFSADNQFNTKRLSSTCFNCHGTDGEAKISNKANSIAGVKQELLLKKLEDFKTGKADSTIMKQIVLGYSEEQLKEITKYLEGIK